MQSSPLRHPPIAVVGISALFPGSTDETGFWRDIVAGRDLIRDVPKTHWLIEDYYDPDPEAADKTYARRGAFLEPIPFDALSFGVPPSILPATDTSQLLALIVAQRVLEDATHGQFANLDKSRISVILGVTSGQELLSSMVSRLQRPVWIKSLREAGVPESKVTEICDRIAGHYVPWQESTFPGLLGNVVAGRIANRFDLGGTNCVVDAACASTFAALSMAMNELWLGQSELVITGGVDTLNDIFMYMCFSKTPALSKTGDCRPFSDQADGTMLGEGLGMVALKRLEDAETAGDPIYAVLRGIGSSSDGRATSVFAPRSEGQAMALQRAYQAAGYGPDTVELVEAHGTGTSAGDVPEFEGLSLTFNASGRTSRQWCALGSIKSQIGHTKAAAGAAGLFKAIMALCHGVLPPTIKVKRVNPKLSIEQSPFYLNTRARPWVRGSDHPRRASVSSFGFGGSNFHVALEEYRGPAPRALRKRVARQELIVLGAPTATALVETLERIEVGGKGFLAWFARHTQTSCAQPAWARLALLAADEAELSAKLSSAAAMIRRRPGQGFALPGGTHYGVGERQAGLAFLFPGQGSQYLGMGGEVAMLWSEALIAWDLAADQPASAAETLQEVVFPPPAFTPAELEAQAERLKRTEWAQPALGAASLAYLNLLGAVGLRPDWVGGHSFGEVTALHAAGVFDAATMLRIGRRRGELMAEAARSPGGMTAVFAPLAEVRSAIADLPSVVVANHNAPSQVVLAGPLGELERAEAALRALGLRLERLPVATAFHSPVVVDSAAPFEAFLAKVPFATPELPVFANLSAAPYPDDPQAMRALLVGQLTHPVRFAEQVEAMCAAGARTFVEVGPGAVLTGLVGKILTGRPHTAINLDVKGGDGAASFHEALGRLWAAGFVMNLGALWASFLPVADPRQTRAPTVAPLICGANYGKPYPPAEGASALPPPNLETTQPAWTVSSPSVSAEDCKAVAAELPDPGEDDAPWLAAYQQAQRETLEAHTAWQEAMTRTHLAFLQAAERSLAELVVPGQRGQHKRRRKKTACYHPEPVAAAPTAVLRPEAPTGPPQLPPALGQVLLEVVAEKTGYPVETLTLAMGLESDLGIDSIKRVEIFAALRSRLPGLPEVEPATMSSLRTLDAVVSYLEGTEARTSATKPETTELTGAAPSSATADLPFPAPLERYVLETVEKSPPGLACPGLFTASRVAVIGDDGGVAEELVTSLCSLGVHVELVSEAPSEVDAVLFLAGLDRASTPDAAVQTMRRAFRSARSVASRFKERGGVFVTVQDTGGDFGLAGNERAWLAGIAGIAKTAAAEWPRASVRAIDLTRDGRDASSVARALLAELLDGGGDSEVGLDAAGRRVVLRLAVGEAPREASSVLDERSVVLASGGGRGITAACLAALAARTRSRFALLGRTVLAEEPAACRGVADAPGLSRALLEAAAAEGAGLSPIQLGARVRSILAVREVRATLDAIRAAGGEARYLTANVRDRPSVERALQAVRLDWGPIHAAVHGAGVVADKWIEDKTDEQFDATFDTKVLGLRVLLEATVGDPLRLICLFSSAAARFGNAGQCDYAAANETLNKVAALEARRRDGVCLVKSLGWGPWDGGMIGPALSAHFRSLGTPLIPVPAGAAAFVDELLSAGGGVEILYGALMRPVAPPWEETAAAHGFEVVISRATHPYLADHCIDDVPVLPVVLVLEWFVRAAKALHPDLQVATCEDVHVLKGARLEQWENGGECFRVHCRPAATSLGSRLCLELSDSSGTPRYRAVVTMANALQPGETPPTMSAPQPCSRAIYGEELFHGPAFQVIRSLEGVSSEGVAGLVAGTREQGWNGPWHIDAAALEGGLQLAVLWTSHVIGGRALPTSIGAYRAYRSNSVAGPLRCLVRGRVDGGSKTLCDISFLGPDGTLVSELQGVEVHRRPDRPSREP